MSTIVIMPGGFHPFHAGHYALYQSAKKAFPNADIYVAATNDQSERPFPFAIKEKLAKLAGVEPGHFVQVKSPFQAKEITSHYDPNKDVLVFVRSEKDRTEQPKPGGTKKDGTPAYFQPWTGKNLQPFSKHAYIAYLPTVEFGPGITSATQIRNAWPTLNDKRKLALVMSLYPATQTNPKLAQNVVHIFDQIMGGVVSEDINEAFDQSYPLKWRTKKGTDGDKFVIATTKLPDGSKLDIEFKLKYKGTQCYITFYRDGTISITGEGDAQKIFGTVIQAINEFLTNIAQPNEVIFSANKDVKPGENSLSRTKLYNRMVQRFAGSHGYNAEIKDRDQFTIYDLTKKDERLEENIDSNLSYQGNCTEDDVIEHIFGDVNNFANMVEEHGDEFTLGDLVVKYDPETDIHSFYYKKQETDEGVAKAATQAGLTVANAALGSIAGQNFGSPTEKSSGEKEVKAKKSPSFDKCFEKAKALYDKALSENGKPILYQVADYKGKADNPDSRWAKLPKHVWSHYVTVVGNTVYDPTAKQFGDDKPEKYNVDNLKYDWGKIFQILPKTNVTESADYLEEK